MARVACNAEVQAEMKVCHFSAMIALLNLAMMTISRRVFATVTYKMENKKMKGWNGKKKSYTACHFQSDSCPSDA